MSLHAALRPPLTSRHGLAVIGRILEALRLRTAASLLRLVAPALSRTRRRRLANYDPLRQPSRLAAAKSMRQSHVDVAVTSDSLVEFVDGNVVPYKEPNEIASEELLERLCIAKEGFHFGRLKKEAAWNGDVVISAEIARGCLHGNLGLHLDEVGRQLSQLGLLAVSACDARGGDMFYVATTASMEEMHNHAPIKAATLKGVARVVRLQAHLARADVELWHRDAVVCRMSVEYDVFSSWQEVLPSLAQSSIP